MQSPPRSNATFSDAGGRVWSLRINVAKARALAAIGVDLANLGDGRVLLELASDWLKLGMTLWTLCEEQADKAGVNEDDFGELLDAPTLTAASDALSEAIVNFTPPARRAAVKAAMAKVGETMRQADAQAVAVIESPETTAMVERMLEKAANEAKRRLMVGD